ncbi:transposase [Streptomyces sp. NPDC048192]|uniref:transposase n=1 Tax=Streptomyces sp. NPDC048192 TaxID=3365510 RepID=UPI003715D435
MVVADDLCGHLEITRKVCEDFEAGLKAFNGARNHVRPLVHHPPKVAAPKLVNSVKCTSEQS